MYEVVEPEEEEEEEEEEECCWELKLASHRLLVPRLRIIEAMSHITCTGTPSITLVRSSVK
jgi:hypothetical protein